MYLSKIPETQYRQDPSLTIKEYRKITNGILRKLTPKFGYSLIEKVFNDDDLYSDCLWATLTADASFKQTGKGNLKRYRFQQVTWALKSYLTKVNRMKRNLSLNQRAYSKEGAVVEWGDLMESPDNPIKQYEDREFIVGRLAELDNNKASAIYNYYINQMTLEEISKELGYSISRIHELIKDGLAQIRRTSNDVC